MLSKEELKWARGLNTTKEEIEFYRQELIRAEENGKYHVYKKDVREMDDDEIKISYSNMKNYLSDMKSHY